MNSHIDVITLAVDDLDASLRFYRDGLGFESEGIVGTEFGGDDTNPNGAVAMFKLAHGMTLCLYPREDLAKDGKIANRPAKSGEFSIGHLVDTKEQVDDVITQAEKAGATIPDQPHNRPWGIYSGYFQDPDGHLWEVICNPAARQNVGTAV